MSNHTPAAIRAKDKERKAQERHPKQIRNERKARWLSGAKLTSKVFGIIFAILGAQLSARSFGL
jgi:hypothetical protein